MAGVLVRSARAEFRGKASPRCPTRRGRTSSKKAPPKSHRHDPQGTIRAGPAGTPVVVYKLLGQARSSASEDGVNPAFGPSRGREPHRSVDPSRRVLPPPGAHTGGCWGTNPGWLWSSFLLEPGGRAAGHGEIIARGRRPQRAADADRRTRDAGAEESFRGPV